MNRECCLNKQSQLNIAGSIGDYIYLNLSTTCSRSCSGCLSASPLADPNDPHKYATLEAVKIAINKMTALNGGYSPQKIDLSGGDAMLCPDLIPIMEFIRSVHPDSPLKIRSNGMHKKVLASETSKVWTEPEYERDYTSKDFWDTLERLNIGFDVRSYHFEDVLYFQKLLKSQKRSIACGPQEFGWESNPVFNEIRYVTNPKVSALDRFLWCSEPNRCRGIDCCYFINDEPHPIYFPCSLPAAWRHIERVYPDTKAFSQLKEGIDYFDLTSNPDPYKMGDNVIHNCCRHCCRGESPGRYSADSVWKGFRSEFILDKDVPTGAGFPEFFHGTPEYIKAPFNCKDHAAQQGLDSPEQCPCKCPNYNNNNGPSIEKMLERSNPVAIKERAYELIKQIKEEAKITEYV